jgi:hypothetical protein
MPYMREHAAPEGIPLRNLQRAPRQDDIQSSRQIVKARAAIFAAGGRLHLEILNLLEHRRLRIQVSHHVARQILQSEQAPLQQAQRQALEARRFVQAGPRRADAHHADHLDVGITRQDVGIVGTDQTSY